MILTAQMYQTSRNKSTMSVYAGSQKTRWLNSRAAALSLASIFLVGALIHLTKDGISSTEKIALEDNADNQFETEENTWDANWDLTEMRHRLITTQIELTTQDKEYETKIAKLEDDINILMDLYQKRPAGPAGLAGPPGPAGAPGKAGVDGKVGDAGQDGNIGPVGLEGPPGPIGEAGKNGVAGSQGLAGPQGVTGRQGDAGAPGQPGPQGEPGLAGRVGPQGDYGDIGPQGPVARINVIHHLNQERSFSTHSSVLAKISDGLDDIDDNNQLERRLDALKQKMDAFKQLLKSRAEEKLYA